MNTLRIDPEASSESLPYSTSIDATSSTLRREPGRYLVPPAIPSSQRYFWTRLWQMGEEESREDLARGDVRRFSDPLDAIRWLLSDDG